MSPLFAQIRILCYVFTMMLTSETFCHNSRYTNSYGMNILKVIVPQYDIIATIFCQMQVSYKNYTGNFSFSSFVQFSIYYYFKGFGIYLQPFKKVFGKV